MDKHIFLEQLSELLEKHFTTEELYDFDKVKDKIAIFTFNETDHTPEPYIILFCDNNILLGYRVTNSHLKLWGKTLEELLPPIDT